MGKTPWDHFLEAFYKNKLKIIIFQFKHIHNLKLQQKHQNQFSSMSFLTNICKKI
jgi:hypothetical protein